MFLVSPYRLFGVHMPDLFCLIAGLLSFVVLLQNGKGLPYTKPYLHFFFYLLLVPPLVTIALGVPGNIGQTLLPTGIIIFTIWMLSLNSLIDYNRILHIYRFIVFFSIAFFYFQELSYLALGVRPTLYIPFLSPYYDNFAITDLSESRSALDRSSSLFLESAHFVEFILPYICIRFFEYIKKRKNIVEIIFLLLTIVVAQSGCGYIEAIFVGLYFFLSQYKANLIVKLGVVFFIILIILGILIIIPDNPIVVGIIERSSEFSTTVEAYGPKSGFKRLFWGYFVYDSMDVWNKLFGLGIGSVEYMFNKTYIPGLNPNANFMNGIQASLIYGGILGTWLLSRFVFMLIRKMTVVSQAIMIAMIGLFFCELMFNNFKTFHYLLIAYCYNLKVKYAYDSE